MVKLKMKVLQILYSGLGGHGSVVTSLIDADAKGEWNHSLLFYGVEELLPAYREFCIKKNIPFSYVRKSKGGFKTNSREVKSVLNKYDPDVVILHSPNLIFFTIWKYCRKRNKKVIVVEHTSNDIKKTPELINGLASLLLASKVVYLSPIYQRQMRRKFWFFPVRKKSVIIRNGINLEKYKPVPKNLSEIELHAGMIGRFLPSKKQSLIVDAVEKIIVSGGSEKKLFVHFAGNGDLQTTLQDAVKNKGLQDRVIFHGLLTEDEIISFLRGLDFYIHASDAEAMCTAVMQAMACGLPIVASDIPGINNIVMANENARLFSNNNMTELINGILAMQDRNLRKEMGENAREYAAGNFSSRKTFQEYNELLRVNNKQMS